MRVEHEATGRLVTADARLRNITKHGFGFVTEEHLTRGGVYRFKLDLLTSPFEVSARIVHFHIEATYYVCGAKIESLSFLQRSRINRFLASRSPELQRKFLIYSLIVGAVVAGAVKLMAGGSTGVTVAAGAAAAILAYLLLPF